MGYLDNFKSKDFWIRVLKLAAVFFLIFVIISLVISHFSEVTSGNFRAVYEDEWADGKWKNYFSIKAVISIVYAIYMTSRRKKLKSRRS